MVTTRKWGRSAAVVSAGLIGLAVTFGTAGTASATAGPEQLEVCNEANNFAVDVWSGSNLLLQAPADSCRTTGFGTAKGSIGIMLFVDNQVTPDEIGAITYERSRAMTVTVTGPNSGDFSFFES